MRDFIVDFGGLEAHLKASDLSYNEAVIDFYSSLGEKHGFTVRKNASIIKHGLNFGRMDLVWLEPNISFTIEFSSFENIVKHLWRILELKPELAVLLLSSKGGCKASDVLKLVRNSPVLEGMKDRILILDLTEKEIVE